MRLGGYTRVVISGYDNLHHILISLAEHTSSRSMTFQKFFPGKKERGEFLENFIYDCVAFL